MPVKNDMNRLRNIMEGWFRNRHIVGEKNSNSTTIQVVGLGGRCASSAVSCDWVGWANALEMDVGCRRVHVLRVHKYWQVGVWTRSGHRWRGSHVACWQVLDVYTDMSIKLRVYRNMWLVDTADWAGAVAWRGVWLYLSLRVRVAWPWCSAHWGGACGRVTAPMAVKLRLQVSDGARSLPIRSG